jgi:LmbE family N-acetylglucosaminyl deacetylase
MQEALRLICVLAHPDDESLGMGGIMAHYAAEGIETYLLTATRGERGRFGDQKESPGLEVVGRARQAELHAAAEVLGVREVSLLNYIDKDLDQANPAEIIAQIAAHLRRVKPHVVVTFGPEGAYGHPDHIAISQFTTAATLAAADSNHAALGQPHRVSKLYYLAWPADKWAAYQLALKDLKATVDGVERRPAPWPDWAVTTVVDTSAVWETVWRAVCCHKTQMSVYRNLEHLPEEHHKGLWGNQAYYRAFSLVNGGRARETDLFEGLR